jgi:hypothetical protein
MDAKQLRKFKVDKIAQLKREILAIPEIKPETRRSEEEDAAACLDAFVSASMNPLSLIQRLTVKDGFGSTIFKKVFHSTLSKSLKNDVSYSLHKNRKKILSTDYLLVTTYKCFDTTETKRFLPTLQSGCVGFDTDLSLLMTVLNENIPIVIKYNWHTQETSLLFEVDKWRGHFVNGCFVGNRL